MNDYPSISSINEGSCKVVRSHVEVDMLRHNSFEVENPIWTMTVFSAALYSKKRKEPKCGAGRECGLEKVKNRISSDITRKQESNRSVNGNDFGDGVFVVMELSAGSNIMTLDEAAMDSAEEDFVINYVVELTNTLEKRLRCQHLQVDLRDCVLEECIDGAVLLSGSTSDWSFSQQSCVEPVQAIVVHGETRQPVPVCTCIQALLAVKSLKLWDATISDREACVLRLNTLRREYQKVNNFYTLEDIEERAASLLVSPDLSLPISRDLKEKLEHHMFQSSSACLLDTGFTEILLCFSASDGEIKPDGNQTACLRIEQFNQESISPSSHGLLQKLMEDFT
ncbi:hypothetical protein RRG08_035792 [Elysia crispata]|uniref:Uncharacterized protein n=1 Tax=Elysia crispata TaxID=231223 RepID=A0AAE0ZLM4_9GAST|nr:hypothetical protein RRG08_035792 [Elysia crispata]